MNNSEADWSLIAHTDSAVKTCTRVEKEYPTDIAVKTCTRLEKEYPQCLLNQKRENRTALNMLRFNCMQCANEMTK